MDRLTQVARSIARQKCLRQLLDPASFEPARCTSMLCLSGSGALVIVGSSISMECGLQSRIEESDLNYPGGSKRNA